MSSRLTEDQRLTGDQLALISALDAPERRATGTADLLANAEEQDVTVRSVNGKTRIFKRFRTDTNAHLYDAVTGDVSELSEVGWALLDEPDWRADSLSTRFPHVTAAELAREARRLDRQLVPLDGPGFIFPKLEVPENLVEQARIRTLVINVTEQCNLRCTYCYYSGGYEDTREHRSLTPPIDLVRASLDRFLSHHEDCGGAQRAIYLFGGEPLLNVPLIEEILVHLRDRAAQLDLDISNVLVQIATNGMLLNSRNVAILEEHGVYLNVSIDGPNHDVHRINAKGRGSLARVMHKLEWLASTYPDYFSTRVGLVCVVSPPIDVPALYDFFQSWTPAQQALHLDFDLILAGGDTGYEAEIENFRKAKALLWDEFIALHRLGVAQRSQSLASFFVTGFNFLHRSFHRVLYRETTPARDGRVHNLLGVQGYPGIFIVLLGADGTLYGSYEFQSQAFEVGNATGGLDKASIDRICANFSAAAQVSSCATCWAARLCNVDFPDVAFSRGDSDAVIQAKVDRKRARCVAERHDLAHALVAEQTIRDRYGAEALEAEGSEWDELLSAGHNASAFARA